MPKRQSNNPKRRIIGTGNLNPDVLRRIIKNARYTGSGHHKTKPADYGFIPPTAPRPNKSVCDSSRSVMLAEAQALFVEGIRRGMISSHIVDGLPKYVWALDTEGNVYEAKISDNSQDYHGYELNNDDNAMRNLVEQEWNSRCPIV